MRLKIIAGNFAVVVLLGLVAYVAVRGEIRSDLRKEIDATVVNDQVLLERSFTLSALTFMSNVSDRAASRQTRDVFAGLDDASRRTRAFEAAEAVFSWMGDPARGPRGVPDIVVIVDETGRALARNGARNVMFGKQLIPVLPAMREVLKRGVPRHDVWFEDNEKKVLQTAMAPIRGEQGVIVGALAVGYDLSDGVAAAEAKVLGRDVAFVIRDKVYSSSLGGETARALSSFLFGGGKASTQAVLLGQASTSQPWAASISGSEYIGITARMPFSQSSPVAYAVLGNRTAKMSLAAHANVIIYMLVLGAVLVLAYGFVMGTSISRQIERVEEGVLAIINGRTDLRLDTDSPELGGLAYRINQLLNVLTGTAEDTEDADGRVSVAASAPGAGAWKEAEFADAQPAAPKPVPAGSAAAGVGAEQVIDDPAIASQLAGEDEKAYETRVYQEYVTAKQALGEDVSTITQERFCARLNGKGAAMAKQHSCRMVRFQVQTKNNQVVLRAVLIR